MCFTVSQEQERVLNSIDEIKSGKVIKIDESHLQDHYLVSGFQYPNLVICDENGISMFNWGLIPF